MLCCVGKSLGAFVGALGGVNYGCSSIGRALDSKSSGWGFKSLRPCLTGVSDWIGQHIFVEIGL